MNQYKTSSQLKNTAKDQLMGKYSNAILVPFLSSVIIFGVNLIITLFSPSVVWFPVSLAASIIMQVFEVGLCLFFLNMSCGQPYSISDLFYGFRAQSNKALIISGVMVLVNTICLTPYQIFMQLFQTTADIKWAALMMLSMGIGLLIYVPLSLSLSQSYYLMLDFPEKNARETLKLSMQVMKGHKCRLFYIQASFIPLMLLGALSFGIGFLWITPYMHMTFTQFFLDIMKPKEL